MKRAFQSQKVFPGYGHEERYSWSERKTVLDTYKSLSLPSQPCSTPCVGSLEIKELEVCPEKGFSSSRQESCAVSSNLLPLLLLPLNDVLPAVRRGATSACLWESTEGVSLSLLSPASVLLSLTLASLLCLFA